MVNENTAYQTRGQRRPRALVNAMLLDPSSTNSAVSDPQQGGVFMVGGKIHDFGPHVTAASFGPETEVIDCGGLTLMPGLVDARVHLSEPGEDHKETLAQTAEAAAYGGVTSLAGLPTTDPIIDDVSVLEYVARRARIAKGAKIFAYAAATKGLSGEHMTEFGLMAQAGACGFHTGLSAIASAKVMGRCLSYAKLFDRAVFSHPEEPALSEGTDMNAGELTTRLGLSGAPAIAECIQVERDVRLAEMTGGRLHVGPLTTAAACEAVRIAKRRGVDVTASTAPQYFTLDETIIGLYRSFGKMTPPLRSDQDRAGVEAAVCDGTIDMIVSDHWPQDADSKRLPFAAASPGAVGLEGLLPLSLRLWAAGKIELAPLLAKLTTNPAKVLGLPQPRLAANAPADLIVVDLNKSIQLRPEELHSKCRNLAFEHLPAQGKVRATVIDGRLIVNDL